MTADRQQTAAWPAYHFAVLRVVPHVHVGTAVPVGVMIHVRTAELLLMRVITDPHHLQRLTPDADIEVLSRYLHTLHAIAIGDPTAGPIALAPSSERFHWLTAPRSDVIQSAPVHAGVCDDPHATLNRLFAMYVKTATAP